ncbi:Bug family tripartite tricarboxylate transporter substrate binding protein [Pseudorhodoferax sp.]|uniref:Bug family tripartite tricarboxylate transporter substrate binding protein n=1 Tax=Pseudorhodoferax sp. TaxID=1993553 RepID=UPI0039E26510
MFGKLCAWTCAIAMAILSTPGWAQDYPAKAVMLIVPSLAGGAVDVAARTIQPRLAQELGQPVVIDNKTGAGGQIGNSFVAKSHPDGYTVLMNAGSTLFSGVYRRLDYNPNELIPVAMVATAGFLLVVPANSPFQSLQDLIAYGKAHPGKLNYASTGTGNSSHVGSEMFKMLSGVQANHIPYRGSAPALVDLISGRVDFMLDNKASSLEHIKAGRLRALGSTPRRVSELPDVPAISEVLPDFHIEGWMGIFLPKGTPQPVVDRLSAAFRATQSDPAIVAKLNAQVGQGVLMQGEELRQFIAQDERRLRRVVEHADIRAD